VGLWRSWERASMAWKRSRVRIPSGPPKPQLIWDIRISVSRMIQIGAALVLVAAIATIALVARQYRRDRESYQRIYTRAVKQRDISDTARNAISALQDAEVREQDYVLTGETSYSEAYADDVRVWQDEFGTLELTAEHDSAAPIIRDLSRNGTRVLDELALITSLYEKGSREAALDRIRKGSAIVYLEQARDQVAKIKQLDGLAADEADQSLVRDTLRSQRRLAAGAAALFGLILAGILLLILEMRRVRRLPESPEPRKKQFVVTTN
jgi:CHASE3 domain sensor protein